MQTKISNATRKARAKKAKSQGLVLQKALKNAWEKEVKGLNSLVNYCTARGKFKSFTDGVSATQAYINYVNEKKKSSIKLSDITLKSVKANLTERELFKKDGSKREVFTTHYVKLAIGRMAK
jgi:hypothetical protein